jgi:hypothetical protein
MAMTATNQPVSRKSEMPSRCSTGLTSSPVTVATAATTAATAAATRCPAADALNNATMNVSRMGLPAPTSG